MLHYMYVTNGAVKILITFCKSTVKLVPVVFLNHHILTNNEINIVYKIVCCYFPVWLIVIITAVNSAPMEHFCICLRSTQNVNNANCPMSMILFNSSHK